MHGLVVNKLTSLTQGRKSPIWNTFAKVSLPALSLVLVILVLVRLDPSDLQALIDHNQNLASIISIFAIALSSLALIPTIPITLFICVLMGPLAATVITALGTTLSALVHYQIGKQIGDVLAFERNKEKLPFKLGKLPVNSPLFLLIGRAMPGGPTGLSFVCGAYCVPHFSYLWTTFTTNLLGAAFVAFGSNVFLRL